MKKGDVWSYWAWRLGHMRTTLVAANTYGWEEHVRFTGRSLILQDRTVMLMRLKRATP